MIAKLIEQMDNRKLSSKIIENSKSLREDLVVYIGMFARGIKEILSYAHIGVAAFKKLKIPIDECIFIEQLSLHL